MLKFGVQSSNRRVFWSLAAAAALVSVALTHSWAAKTQPVSPPSAAVPLVAVVKVDREDLYREITVPAEFRPFNEVDVHAKVSGYVKRMYVDIGDRVKSGQLLAVLEIPELGDDLQHAIAARQRMEADFKDAHLAYSRLVAVNRQHPNLIAQQDLDSAEARDATAKGALAAAEADVRKYETLVSYTRITAPFDGVITKRYADLGALIQAGTTSQTQAMPLVRLSENTRLRLDFPVSVDYVQAIRLGASVSGRVDSLNGLRFDGKVARFTGRVDPSTRTMIVETEVDNDSLRLVPGMYADVTIRIDQRQRALAIPVEAVPPGAKTVLVVNSYQRLEQRPVKLGLETPAKYEVLSGLNAGDLVIEGNPAQLSAGERVVPRIVAPLARD